MASKKKKKKVQKASAPTRSTTAKTAKAKKSKSAATRAKSASTSSVKKSKAKETTAKKPSSPVKEKAKAKSATDSLPAKAKVAAKVASPAKVEAVKPEVVKPVAVAPAPVAEKPKAAAPVAPARAPIPAASRPIAPVVEKKVEPVSKAVAPVAVSPVRPTSTPAATPARAGTVKQSLRTGYKTNEFIVYPAHGVGQIIAIEEQEVAGFKLELFVINFVKDKMTLKVPLPKVLAGAIRKLSEPESIKRSLDILTGRARIKRTMWSRRAQEYESKINSGDINAIAEVVRDLFRSEAQPEQSYSERQLYEAALDRMAREVAAVHRVTETEALKLIESHLLKGPRRGAKAEAGDGAPVEVEVGQAA